MLVNFVISKDLNSRILRDIYQRFVDHPSDELNIIISESPVENADIYHYHRTHLETELAHPAVATVHHDPEDIDPWLEPTKFEERYSEADLIICLNSLQVSHYHARGISHTCIIPHGYDSKLLYRREAKRFSFGQKLRLGFISKRYDRRFKGEVYLYELLLRLNPQDFSFTFVGSGRGEDAVFAKSLGFDVEVFEHLPYRLFGSLYDGIDILLMVSNYEGGPANLPEAIAARTPILCTKVGMAVDLIIDGCNGYFLSGNVDKDLPLFKRLAIDDQGITSSIFQTSAGARTAITWEAVVERHIEAYKNILIKRQASFSQPPHLLSSPTNSF